MNKIIILGRLGADATVNTVNNKNVINLNVATSETWKNAQGERQEKTTWFNVAKWQESTAIVPYLKKGTQVLVEGSVELRTYEKKDGSEGASLNIKAQSITLVGGSGNSAAGNNGIQDAVVVDDNNDLPF